MNEAEGASAPTPRRGTSDFSIERILSKDNVSSSTSFATSSSVKGMFSVSGQTCASFLEPSVAIHSSPVFVVQNKLDWLRNFCGSPSPSKSHLETGKPNTHTNSSESISRNRDLNSTSFNGEELAWLRCTRYRPPKLPRKSSTAKNLKRKPGSHPRIPFTKYQLEILEDKYKSSAYLSRKDVVNLSGLLQLPQSRIKIWFQNRRARERRESQTLDESQTTRL